MVRGERALRAGCHAGVFADSQLPACWLSIFCQPADRVRAQISTQQAYKTELMQLLREFADNARRLRKQKGLSRSQENLAHDTNLHRTQIGKIECAKVEPRLSTLLILADGLGVTLNDLVEGLPAPKERKPPPGRRRK
jgi:ribosome-binding protein aMBF1 (putative translation factor)